MNGKWQQFLNTQDPTPNAELKLVSYPNTVKASLATSTGPPYLMSPTLKSLRNLQCWFLSNLFPSSFAATLTLARSYFPNTELKPLNHLKLVLAFFVTSTCPTNVARPAWKLHKSLHFSFFNLLHISLQLLGHSQ